jgi:hypothetical protein
VLVYVLCWGHRREEDPIEHHVLVCVLCWGHRREEDPIKHHAGVPLLVMLLQGIDVKMITGDHLLIGKETARMLGMGTQV